MTNPIELCYPVVGKGAYNADHGYALLGAVSRIVPRIHSALDVGLLPIRGMPLGNGRLQLTRSSALVIRAPVNYVPDLLALAGKQLVLPGCLMRVGSPRVRNLTPATSLWSRIVTIKGFMTVDGFAQAARRQLNALEIRIGVGFELGGRRVIRIKGKAIVGFAVALHDLTPEESLRVQSRGIGGRRHVGGCGIFVPVTRSLLSQPTIIAHTE